MMRLTRHYRQLTLRAKLALGVSLTVAMVVIVLMLALLLTVRRDMTHTVTQVQSSLIEGVVRDLDGKLELRRNALLLEGAALGQRVALSEGEALKDFFVGRPLLLSLFDTVVLADAAGAVIYDSSAAKGRSRFNVADRDYFQAAMSAQEIVISQPLMSRTSGAPVVTFAAPVRNSAGQTAAVLVGVLRLDQPNFLSDVGSLRIGQSGYFGLMTRHEPPITIAMGQAAAPAQKALPGVVRKGDPGFQEALADTSNTAKDTVEGLGADGTQALFTYRKLAFAPWVVEAVYPSDEAFASLGQRQREVLLVGLCAALVGWLTVWLLTTRLLAPLDKLRHALQRDATGSDDMLQAIQTDSADVAALLQAYYDQKNRRVALETAFVASERRLRDIADNLPALVAYIDVTETYRFANSHYQSLLGIDPKTMLGRTVEQAVGAKAYEGVKSQIAAVLRGEAQQFEREGEGLNGDQHLLVSYIPNIAEDGGVIGFYAMTMDITERKLTELALAQSEQRVRAIADNLPAMISHFDRDLRYTFANATVGQVFGCEASSLVGRLLRDVRGEAVYADMQPKMARALAGERISFEVSSVTDGRQEYFEANYVPEIDAAGQVLGFYALTFEVTQRKEAEAQARASQELLDRTGLIGGVGGWELELASGAIRWTAQTRRIHEADDDYVPTVEAAISFYVGEARQTIEQAVRMAIHSGTPWNVVLPLLTAKGRSIWVRTTGEAEYNDGKLVRLFGVCQDVSQRVANEQQLREQAELLQVTLKSIADGVITADESGCVRWMNPAAERMTGWLTAAACGQPVARVFHIVHADTRAPDPDPVALCLSSSGLADSPSRSVLISQAGQEFAVEDSASPIRDEEGRVRGAVLVFHDVSEQRRMSDQMTHRATHDALTGLVNRAEFDTRLERVLTQARGDGGVSALMFIDLDHFKRVNDACGHAMGDTLLCQVSALMAKCVRHRDTLARLGGDEFGVIFEQCTVEQAQRVAQNICDQMDEFRFVHDGRRFRLGTSIGLVPIDARWPSQAALRQAADTACYAAKEGGRNRVHVWMDTDQALQVRQGDTQWGSRLESALDEDSFVLYAQQVQALQAEACGLHCEVLLRLREADGTVVEAGKFLPAAERFHMASRIDRWVVRQVFEWLAAEGGSPDDIATIAINLSGQSIGDRAFHRFVVELIKEIPVDARKLCFEVTETSAITNLSDATAFIQAMRKLGMRVALDDFGAGASSFGYLKNLPVDSLKIDGQFIVNIQDNPLDMAAVRCFHEVAKAIGVKTVAEFVETERVMTTLREIGIDYVQGYLIHRPEPLVAWVGKIRGEALVSG